MSGSRKLRVNIQGDNLSRTALGILKNLLLNENVEEVKADDADVIILCGKMYNLKKREVFVNFINNNIYKVFQLEVGYDNNYHFSKIDTFTKARTSTKYNLGNSSEFIKRMRSRLGLTLEIDNEIPKDNPLDELFNW